MKIDRDTALMAMGLHETMLYADALHMEKDKLLHEIRELSDYSLTTPIHITEPRKWVRLNALARAAKDRGILKMSIPILTCTQQFRMQECMDNNRKSKD